MILERILPILSDREETNYSMYIYRRFKPKGNRRTYWLKSNACLSLATYCNQKLQEAAKQ